MKMRSMKRPMKAKCQTKYGDCNGTKVKVVGCYNTKKQYVVKSYKKSWLGGYSLCKTQKGAVARTCFMNMSACNYFKAYCCA